MAAMLGKTQEKKGKTAIVTGASRGIGRAIAMALGIAGWNVAVNFATDQTAAEKVVVDLLQAGVNAAAIQADVSQERDVLLLFETAERELGPIGALVNNAGVTGGLTRVEHLSADAIDLTLAVNVKGVMLCTREALKRMSLRNGGPGGAIVNISSLAARIGGAGEWVHYAAAKGAVNSFTIGAAREVATEGIRINCVSPGLIETELHARNGVPDRLDRLKNTIPMERAGTAEEVAAAVSWLLSDSAAYITGTILEVGGGR
jgi:NAD(P)-dependent dehydrogenase (short-subunit alcohol dehydrogenase family)